MVRTFSDAFILMMMKKKKHMILHGKHCKPGDEVSEPHCTPMSDTHNVSSEQSPEVSPHPIKCSSFSFDAHIQQPQSSFSRSSLFCTSLHLSSSSSLETTLRLQSLPFLPDPSPRKLPNFTNLSSDSSSFVQRDSSSLVQSCRGPSEGSLRSSQNIHGGSSDGSVNHEHCGLDSLHLTEQMELQLLSDELHIVIGGDGENPRIDEIYEEPQALIQVCSDMTANQNNISCTLPSDKLSAQQSVGSHKQRMRWTPELHDCFMEAVKKLDGPEKATPKAVLKLMNVEGLTIYHVKSHLQKYRLAKYMPERSEDKKTSSTEDKKATVINKASEGKGKGNIQVLEALRMQMEVQKQLHEQLEVQRALQSRIEEHARYLQKIFEEQQKAGCSDASQMGSCTDSDQILSSSPASISPSGCMPSPTLETEDGGAIIENEPPQKRPRTKEVQEDGCKS